MNRILDVCLCVMLLASPTAAFGQARATGADMTGIVTDTSGGVLPGASVTVTNRDTNVSRTVVTAATGRYIVPALPLGTYTVTVTLDRFATTTREGVELALGQTAAIDFELARARRGKK
jgi:carboxypeptidase family protein